MQAGYIPSLGEFYRIYGITQERLDRAGPLSELLAKASADLTAAEAQLWYGSDKPGIQ